MSEGKSITTCLPQYFDIWIGTFLFILSYLSNNKKKKKKGNNCTLLALFMYLGQERRKINYGKEKLLSMVIVCV